jgi:hypothetical protein
MTRGLKFCASAMFSPTVLPLAVTMRPGAACAISFITAGRPPA